MTATEGLGSDGWANATDDLGDLHVRRTREDWLLDAYEALRAWFREQAEVTLPEMIRISAGFGYHAKAENGVILGQTWASWKSADKVHQVFVSPEIADPVQVLAILVHEVVHVVDDCAHGHGKEFKALATQVGLTDRMTEVHITTKLRDYLDILAIELGAYPHTALQVHRVRELTAPDGTPITDRGTSGPKKQNARMIKIECPVDGYTVRTTAKWIDVGLPSCPAGHPMKITDPHWEG